MAARAGLIGTALAGVAALFGMLGCATRHNGPTTDHFDGREFRNAVPPPANAFWGFLRWQLFERAVHPGLTACPAEGMYLRSA